MTNKEVEDSKGGRADGRVRVRGREEKFWKEGGGRVDEVFGLWKEKG